MTEDEKYDFDESRFKEDIQEAFSIIFYEAYMYFCLDPLAIGVSEASKRAYEYAEDGALNRVRKKYEGKSEKEYAAILQALFRREIIYSIEKDPTRLDDFSRAAEKLTKMAEMLPPLSKIKRT